MGTITRKLRRQWGPKGDRGSRSRYPLYRTPSVSSLAARVSRLSRTLFRSSELKHYDQNFNASVGTIPLAGVMLSLSQVPQNDTETGRTGLRISPKSLDVDINMVFADTYNKIRIIIFRWYDSIAPVASSFFQTGYTTYVQAPLSWVQRPRYKIMYDYKTQVSQTVDEVAYFRKRFTFPSTDQITYNGSGSTAYENGQIYMFICSDSGVVTHPTCTGYSRLTYTDL